MSAYLALADVADAVVAAPPNGKAGPVALFVIVLLCVAAYFLFRSMSRHLRRVPEEFAPTTAADLGDGAADGAQPATPERTGDAS